MNPEEMEQQWQQQSQEAARTVSRWRQAHPKATMAEIEAAVDEQMTQLRARLIEEAVEVKESPKASQGERPRQCPHCGERMQGRGKHQRHLQTQGGQRVTLTREYFTCPSCGYGFFPPR